MLKRMIVLTLIIVALQVRADKPTDNSTFIDGHFIKDSVLVMVSGAVYGSGIEAFCYKLTPPDHNRALYCKTFAAESLALINLFEAQQPVWTLATCRKLNQLFVVIASVYIASAPLWFSTIRTVLASVFCYQLIRISTDCTAHYLWKPDLYNLKRVLTSYVGINGFSTGLLIGGPVIWHRQNLEGGLKSLLLILTTTGIALLSTIFYMILVEPEERFSTLEKVLALASGVALTSVGATILALAGAGTEAGLGGGVLATAGAVFGAVSVAAGATEVRTRFEFGPVALVVAVTGAGAGAGLLIITTTRFLLQRLSNDEQPHTISRSLAQAALISVPFLISSWLLSVNQWVMNNVTAHETMQGVYYPDSAKALFSGEWTEALYHLLWLSE